MMALFVVLAMLLSGCNLLNAPPVNPSPTVTLTPGAGTLLPTNTASAAPDTPGAASASPPSPATPTQPPPPTTRPPRVTPSAPPASPSQPPASPSGDNPSITFFIASPNEIDPGGSLTLSWKATGETITLYSLNPAGQLASQGTIVSPEGSTTVATDSSVRNSVGYMLFATTGDKTVSASLQVAVTCPDTWFFANPPNICPRTSAIVSQGAYEHFEHGLMIWVAETGNITVLYDDQISSPRWSQFQNQWQSSMPDSDPTIVAPAGLYQPQRGFGLIWREESTGQPYSPRARLGWATEIESSFTTAVQCDSAYKYSSCYLTGPSGETIWLKPEFSGWQVWAGPS